VLFRQCGRRTIPSYFYTSPGHIRSVEWNFVHGKQNPSFWCDTGGLARCWFGSVGSVMDGWPSRYVTSHPGQLSLAIPLWVDALSTSKSWDVNRHTARSTGSVSVVLQCKNWCLAEGQGNRDQRRPMGPKAWEELYIFTLQLCRRRLARCVCCPSVCGSWLYCGLCFP